MSDSLHQLWRYNNWANTILIDTLRRQEDDVPPACLNLLSHIVNAQMIWLNRIEGVAPIVGVWDEHTLSECETYHIQSSNGLQQKVLDYQDGEMIDIQYTNTKNEEFSNTLLDILLHLFNHGTYHRAQIAKEMKNNGFQPINTDYITFARL